MSDETQVLPRFITGEFLPEQAPGCLDMFTSRSFQMLASGLAGFAVGLLTMGALLALVMLG